MTTNTPIPPTHIAIHNPTSCLLIFLSQINHNFTWYHNQPQLLNTNLPKESTPQKFHNRTYSPTSIQVPNTIAKPNHSIKHSTKPQPLQNHKNTKITSPHTTNHTPLIILQNIYPKNSTRLTKEQAIPNLFSHTIIHLHSYTKIHLRKPTLSYYKGYFIPNSLFLLTCGDIEANPGPMPNTLHTHPTAHRRCNKTYFIPCTIKLQPKYQHLETSYTNKNFDIITNKWLHHSPKYSYKLHPLQQPTSMYI